MSFYHGNSELKHMYLVMLCPHSIYSPNTLKLAYIVIYISVFVLSYRSCLRTWPSQTRGGKNVIVVASGSGDNRRREIVHH